MRRDMHNNVDVVRAITPVAIGATGTGQSSVIVDTRGYDGVEFVFSYGALATNATITPTVFEGDTTGALTSVADADLLGTEAAAGLAQATGRTSGVFQNVTKRLGYIGDARYVKVDLDSTVTSDCIVAANVILSKPHRAPVAT